MRKPGVTEIIVPDPELGGGFADIRNSFPTMVNLLSDGCCNEFNCDVPGTIVYETVPSDIVVS